MNIYLVLLESKDESFYKIGICGRLFSRFSEMKRYYNVTVIYFIIDIKNAIDIELELQEINTQYSYLPLVKFGGYLECFSYIDHECFFEFVKSNVNHDFEYYKNIDIGTNGWVD